MSRYLALSLLALGTFHAAPVAAQPVGTVSGDRTTMCDPLYVGQEKPTDMPACIVTPATWPSGTNNAIIGDGVTPNTGGLAPANVTPPIAAIPTVNPSAYTVATTLANAGCDPNASAEDGCTEAKFRTSVGVVGLAYADPIRNWNAPGRSHLHTFFGGCEFGDKTLYAQQRRINALGDTTRNSDCSLADGKNLNNTLYWEPALVTCSGGTPAALTSVGGVPAVALTEANTPRGNCTGGKLAAIRRDKITVYYATGPSRGIHLQPIAVGQTYVVGYNMDDPNATKNRVAAANAAAGYTRYRAQEGAPTTPSGNYWASTASDSYAYHSWKCTGADAIKRSTQVLRNPDGTDGFGGNCPAGSIELFFTTSTQGVNCWDGRNLWSPGGYAQLRPPLWDITNSATACEEGWYKVPGLQTNHTFYHNGFTPRADGTGYGAWELSSDAMAPNPDGGVGVPPGFSFHTDWKDGWDNATRRKWEAFCIGMSLLSGTTTPDGPYECNDSAFSPDAKMPNNTLYSSSDLPSEFGLPAGQKVTLIPQKNSGSITTHPGH